MINRFLCAVMASILAVLAVPASAQQIKQAPGAELGSRWAASVDTIVWPSLTDIDPISGGSFDSIGFGLSGSWHAPVARFDRSDLMLGVDIMFGATDSSINASYDQLVARQFYLGGSVKWAFGQARNIGLDLGVGYHEVDMADISYSWWTSIENEHWNSEAASAFVGLTWDIGAGRPHHKSGFSLGFRVHFVDFGDVSDADRLGIWPALGPDAGYLEGPIYFLKLGYSYRTSTELY